MKIFSFLFQQRNATETSATSSAFWHELKKPDVYPMVFFCLAMIISFNSNESVWQQNVQLAQSFLQGEAYLDNRSQTFGYFQFKGKTYPDNLVDTFEVNGKHYWHQSPLPAVVFVPFVWLFGPLPLQNIFSIFISVANVYLVFALARILGIERPKDAFLVALAFVFGSAFIEVAISPNAWQFNQNAATFFTLFSFFEFFTKKRWGRIGAYSALAAGLRLQLLPIFLFFAVEFFFQEKNQKRIRNFVSLLLPMILLILFFSWYNYIRTGSVSLMTGFVNNMVGLPDQLTALRDAYGSFSLHFVPQNIYYYFLKGFTPVTELNAGGANPFHVISPYIYISRISAASLLILMPLVAFIRLNALKKPLVLRIFATTFLILLPLLFHYYSQPRYAVDFMPLLLIPTLMSIHSPFTKTKEAVLIFFVLAHFWFFFLSFKMYY